MFEHLRTTISSRWNRKRTQKRAAFGQGGRRLGHEWLESRNLLAVFTVNSSGDAVDQFGGPFPNDGSLTLRDAVAYIADPFAVPLPGVGDRNPIAGDVFSHTHTIRFAFGLSGQTISLLHGGLSLSGNNGTELVTIEAADAFGVALAKPITINAGGLSRIFQIQNTVVTIDGKATTGKQYGFSFTGGHDLEARAAGRFIANRAR